MKNIFLIFLFLICALTSHAGIKPGFQFLFGATSLPLNSVTTQNSAKKDFLGELYNSLGVKYNFTGGSDYQYSAILTTTKISLISNKDKDKGLTTSLTQLEGNLVFSSSSSFQFKSQLGILMYEMKGSGGQVDLPNGTSTATFDLPSKTVNAQTIYLGGGVQYDFGSFSLAADLNFLSFFSNTRRNYFLSLTLGVPL